MKCIDADKLIAEIEKRKELLENGTGHPEVMKRVEGVIKAYNSILSFITSLQQEQEQHVIGGRVFGATDVEQLYEGKVYIVSNLVQDTEFGIEPRQEVKMLLIKD